MGPLKVALLSGWAVSSWGQNFPSPFETESLAHLQAQWRELKPIAPPGMMSAPCAALRRSYYGLLRRNPDQFEDGFEQTAAQPPLEEPATPEWMRAREAIDEMAGHILRANRIDPTPLCPTLLYPNDQCMDATGWDQSIDGIDYRMVVLCAGFIKAVHGDSELGFMIGHELAHLSLGQSRHSEELESEHRAALSGDDWQEQLKRYYRGRRAEETEADRLGMVYAIKAGYDFHEALPVFVHFGAWSEQDESRDPGRQDHPSREERLRALDHSFAPMLESLQSQEPPVNNLAEIKSLIGG